MPRKLRAVEPGEKPQKKLTVTEAAALNDHREMLVALRDSPRSVGCGTFD